MTEPGDKKKVIQFIFEEGYLFRRSLEFVSSITQYGVFEFDQKFILLTQHPKNMKGVLNRFIIKVNELKNHVNTFDNTTVKLKLDLIDFWKKISKAKHGRSHIGFAYQEGVPEVNIILYQIDPNTQEVSTSSNPIKLYELDEEDKKVITASDYDITKDKPIYTCLSKKLVDLASHLNDQYANKIRITPQYGDNRGIIIDALSADGKLIAKIPWTHGSVPTMDALAKMMNSLELKETKDNKSIEIRKELWQHWSCLTKLGKESYLIIRCDNDKPIRFDIDLSRYGWMITYFQQVE